MWWVHLCLPLQLVSVTCRVLPGKLFFSRPFSTEHTSTRTARGDAFTERELEHSSKSSPCRGGPRPPAGRQAPAAAAVQTCTGQGPCAAPSSRQGHGPCRFLLFLFMVAKGLRQPRALCQPPREEVCRRPQGRVRLVSTSTQPPRAAAPRCCCSSRRPECPGVGTVLPASLGHCFWPNAHFC